MTTDTLDDDHPLWLVNEQIKGLLEGDGASEDHDAVIAFLRNTGLPEGTVKRMHEAIVFGDTKVRVPDRVGAQADLTPKCECTTLGPHYCSVHAA